MCVVDALNRLGIIQFFIAHKNKNKISDANKTVN